MSGIGALKFLNAYFEGTGYGCSRAYGFTQGAPMALFRLDNPDNIGNQHYGVTGTDIDTQPTAVAFPLVYFRHFSQYR